MKIKLITIGKTDEQYLLEGIDKYISRLKHYVSFELTVISDLKMGKKANLELQKEKEGEEILQRIAKNEYVVLLDENQ